MTRHNFQDKVAIVSGGTKGIGRALSQALQTAGAVVEVFDIASNSPVDVSDAAQVARAVENVVKRHGKLDLVFSNAGFLRAGPTDTFPMETFDLTISVNLKGAFTLARACIPHLRAHQGVIVFTSSTSGLVGASGEAAYAAAKAGIIGLARSLAAELAFDGVRVNVVAPGWIDTPFNDPVWALASDQSQAKQEALQMVPMRRQATPEELVPAMMFLASNEASYITGQVLVVDGGLSGTR